MGRSVRLWKTEESKTSATFSTAQTKTMSVSLGVSARTEGSPARQHPEHDWYNHQDERSNRLLRHLSNNGDKGGEFRCADPERTEDTGRAREGWPWPVRRHGRWSISRVAQGWFACQAPKQALAGKRGCRECCASRASSYQATQLAAAAGAAPRAAASRECYPCACGPRRRAAG